MYKLEAWTVGPAGGLTVSEDVDELPQVEQPSLL